MDLDNFGKLPPQSIKYEEAVLGTVIGDSTVLPDVIDILPIKEVFYKKTHQKIWAAILEMYNKGRHIDMVTLTEHLNEKDQLEEIGGPYYIVHLSNLFVLYNPVKTKQQAKLIYDRFISREIIRISNESMNKAYDISEDPMDVISYNERELHGVLSHVSYDGADGIGKLIQQEENEIKKRYELYKSGVLSGVPTGHKELDRFTGGIKIGALTTVAARPSIGKTAFVVQIAEEAARNGFPVLYFACEGSKEAITKRIVLRHLLDVHHNQYNTGVLSAGQKLEFDRIKRESPEWKIKIDDKASPDVSYIKRQVRKNKGTKVVIVDQTSHMRLEKGDNRVLQIGNTLKMFVALAKEDNIAVIVVAQIGRKAEDRGGDKKPTLGDLKDSGSYEEDSETVLLLYRPEYYGMNEDKDGNSTKNMGLVIVAKNREAPTGDIKFEHDGKIRVFKEIQRQDVFDENDEEFTPF